MRTEIKLGQGGPCCVAQAGQAFQVCHWNVGITDLPISLDFFFLNDRVSCSPYWFQIYYVAKVSCDSPIPSSFRINTLNSS